MSGILKLVAGLFALVGLGLTISVIGTVFLGGYSLLTNFSCLGGLMWFGTVIGLLVANNIVSGVGMAIHREAQLAEFGSDKPYDPGEW